MSDVTILELGKTIIVPLQEELHDLSARQMQSEVLKRVEESGAKGLVLDVSVLTMVDSFLGRLLVETSQMAKLMGTETVLVGLRKEVVLTIIHLGLELKGIHTALNLEDGLALLDKILESGKIRR